MLTDHPLDRREFLKAAAAAAAACSLGACGRPGDALPGGILDAAQRRTLAALCGQIIPPDDDPGAVESGVVEFIDRQLATHYSNFHALYAIGLQGVDQAAQALAGASLADLGSEKQIEVLRALEDGTAEGAVWEETSSVTFFQVVVVHTMYGFYGDPRHGGNRDGASWRMVGLPYPPVSGRNQYRFDSAESPDPSGEGV